MQRSMKKSSLRRNWEFFEQHRERLAAKHHGQYVILYKDTFLGFARSEVAAYRQALKKGLGNRDFYIGHCIYKHEEIPAKIRVKTAPI